MAGIRNSPVPGFSTGAMKRICTSPVLVLVLLTIAALSGCAPKTLPVPEPITLRETGRDGPFIAYDNDTVLDTRTNLMWAARDNGSNVNWSEARRYCETYRGGGYSDWRMPTQGELAGLYDPASSYQATQLTLFNVHLTGLIELSSPLIWASETRGSDAASFSFIRGGRNWTYRFYDSYTYRALPVRSGG